MKLKRPLQGTLLAFAFLSLCLAPSFLFAYTQPFSCVITIHSVELKNSAGQWVTVIEPDKQVDLAKEEAGLSFFNNGRVPDGGYVNFRLKLFDSGHQPLEVFGSMDFIKPLVVQKGSFVGVWFTLDLAKMAVSELTITVDQDTRNLAHQEVQMRSQDS